MLTEPGSKDTARPNQSSTASDRVVFDDHATGPHSDITLTSPHHRGADSPGPFRDLVVAEKLWAGLVFYIAARRSMRLYVAETDKYDDGVKNIPRQRPDRPAAVPIFRDGRAAILVFDFDLDKSIDTATAAAAVERDADRAIALLHKCGARWVVDRSPLGGMHILVPLAPGETMGLRWLRPLLQRLKAAFPTLDTSPMLRPDRGCITVPGSSTKHGGYRDLVGMDLNDAIAAFTARSRPGLVARLNAELDPQAFLSTSIGENPTGAMVDPTATTSGLSDLIGPASGDRLPESIITTSPMPQWVAEFCRHGTLPSYKAPDGTSWTPSHARLAVLYHHAARGWSLVGVEATSTDPAWNSFWRGYGQRRDRLQRLAADWRKAFSQARRVRERVAEKSSGSAHKVSKHTGGAGGIPTLWRKLADARKWILLTDAFPSERRASALAVVTAIAYGMTLTGNNFAEMGVRWLADGSGCSEDTVVSVLRILRETPGSPVRRVSRWNALSRTGDGYTLVDARMDGTRVRAADWEARAARPAKIDAVWRMIGLSAWWTHTVLATVQSQTGSVLKPSELAAASRMSLSTVHRTVRELAAHGLAEYGHGWVASTDRAASQVPGLSTAAEEDRKRRLARYARERAEFEAFLAMIVRNWSAREIRGYASLDELRTDNEDYWTALAPDAVAGTRCHPLPDLVPHSPEDAAALDLLQQMLGATVLDYGAEELVLSKSPVNLSGSAP